MIKVSRTPKKLKPFFWKKINPPSTATVWHDLPLDIQIDLSDLESTFVVHKTPTTHSHLSQKKHNVTTVLDITRANNIGTHPH
jgi:hypothetical protein